MVDLLKTAMTQQANYSQGHSHLHATPYQSMSWQAESPGPAASGSHRQRGVPQNPDPQRAVGFTGQPAYPAPERRVESAYQFSPPTEDPESVGRSVVNRCLALAHRNEYLRPRFQGTTKDGKLYGSYVPGGLDRKL